MPKPWLSRTPTTAADVDLLEPRRGHHRDRRLRHAQPTKGIGRRHPVASPSSSFPPTAGTMESGEPDHGKPRRQALRAQGEPLVLKHFLALSIMLLILPAPVICERRRSASPSSLLRRPLGGGAATSRFTATRWFKWNQLLVRAWPKSSPPATSARRPPCPLPRLQF